MPVPLEQFVKQLEESGILAAETLGEFLPPKSAPQDGEDLARELVRHKKLTKFQAEEIFRGNGKSLSLGNYVLLEKIGAGGMGQVFKAEHRRMHRIVAVKMLPGAMMQNAAVVARFEREVMAAAKLNHPNIVTAFDADNAHDVHLLVMEYVEGSDLAALVKKNGPCSVGHAVNYILQAATGLAAAHAEGIVHRDIKPANLLLDKEGTVKILDMGLARLSADVDADKQAGLTNTGTIMGTVDYMAPEQALDTKTADARADIYSLGCSLFYLLTGKATYQGDTLMKKLLAHREQPIPSLRAIRPEAPEQLEAIFRKMTAKRIEDRYQTMTEVIADLEQLGTGQVSLARVQPSLALSPDTGLTDFLRDISLADAAPARRKKSAGPLAGKSKQKLLLIGGGALGMLVLALSIWALSGNRSVRTADGKKPNAKLAPAEEGWPGWPADAPAPAIAPFTAKQAQKHQEAWARYLKVDVEYENSIGMKFVLIPPGEFMMGSTPAEITEMLALVGGDPHWQQCLQSAVPQHKVVLTQPIYIGVYEVTQGQYEQVMGQNPSSFAPAGRGKDGAAGLETTTNHPVETVSWNDAAEFSTKLTQLEQLGPFYLRAGEAVTILEGGGYRLPTEAEWEFACRAGTTTRYWAGASDADLTQAGWFSSNSSGGNHAVGELNANPLGLFDSHGNVWEWVQDGWEPSYYAGFTNSAAIDPTGPALSSSERVTKGGIWALAAPFGGASIRYGTEQTRRSEGIGFRVALVVDAVKKTSRTKPVVTFIDPPFQKWMQQVALMPAAGQVKAVAEKLRELNRGFDGKVTPTIEAGIVTRLEFPADKVTDLSPVRALAELRWLTCCGRSPTEKGQLADLSPLRGMPLTRLDVKYNQVADLSPLTELPLTVLFCSHTSVADLAPLRGMPLRQLDISGTEVVDLSSLAELRLTWLHFSSTRVSDLAPISRLPLFSLGFSESSVCDLSPLAGMQIGELTFNRTRVSDLSPLVGMPLAYLGCLTTSVPDLGLLRGMQLQGIWCDVKSQGDIAILRSFAGLVMIDGSPATDFWTKVEAEEAAFEAWRKQVAGLPAPMQVQAVADKLKDYSPRFDGKVDHAIENGKVVSLAFVSDSITDISPVRALEGLQKLSCPGSAPGQSRLADLWPLRGTAVADLDVSHTAVTNLTPLAESKLASLDLGQTPVADLSPLARTGLSHLHINDTRVTDLAPLAGLPLAELDYSGVCVADVSPLRELPLQVVRCGFKPVRDATFLRAITTLETIDGQPAAAFWKEADARQAAFDRWQHDVESLPAERQVQAVAKKLKELNPGFDGMLKPEIAGGVVVRMDFICDHVTDISPLRALTGLITLDCSGSAPSLGKLADLWPLKGLPLQVLNCTMSQVSDLSPLKGSSLQGLSIFLTQVSDLSPLAGIPLASLHCGGLTNVTDLAPLRGMPLAVLNFHGSNVTNLAPLRGLPLSNLDFAGAPISDLGPLRGMPLTGLVCSSTRVATLAPLKGMPLTNLQFANTLVTDLSPIRGMPLTHLIGDFSPLRDTEVLKTLKNLAQINGQPAAEFWKAVGVRRKAE